MKLRFALIGEGNTELHLVEHLKILCSREGFHAVEGVWATDLLRLRNSGAGKDVASKVSALLAVDAEFDLLFIHRDIDNFSVEVRRREIAGAMRDHGAGKPYVPVIPIRETEAWLLLDEAAIRAVVGNPRGKTELELPKKLSQIEQCADPKEILLEALRRAARHGRRHAISENDFGRLRGELLRNLDIDGPVNQLSAWQNLLRDLKAALAALSPN